MSDRSRGNRLRMERRWRKEKEAKRKERLAGLKAAVLAPLKTQEEL